jgi:hypothetical protein
MLDPRFKDGKEARLTVQELRAGGEYIIELACHLDQLRTARKAEMARDAAILGEQLLSQPQFENPYLQFAADLPDDGAVEEAGGGGNWGERVRTPDEAGAHRLQAIRSSSLCLGRCVPFLEQGCLDMVA